MFKVYINNGVDKPPTDDIFYIIGKKGIFLKKKLGIMESIAPVKNISILEDVETSAYLHIPKIPGKLFTQVYKFVKKVYELHKTESVTLLYYNEDNKSFKILVPEQEVSGANVDYKEIESLDAKPLPVQVVRPEKPTEPPITCGVTLPEEISTKKVSKKISVKPKTKTVKESKPAELSEEPTKSLKVTKSQIEEPKKNVESIETVKPEDSKEKEVTEKPKKTKLKLTVKKSKKEEE